MYIRPCKKCIRANFAELCLLR